jgi:hypothetical protein
MPLFVVFEHLHYYNSYFANSGSVYELYYSPRMDQ